MNKETELDMNDLINSFDEYSTDYTKTACVYYGNYLRDYQKEKLQLQNNWDALKSWLDEVLNEIKENDIYDRTEYECTQIATLESVLAKVEELESEQQ